jgi:hypothetical protein
MRWETKIGDKKRIQKGNMWADEVDLHWSVCGVSL